MGVMVGGFVVTEAAEGFDDCLLRLGLAGVDYVVDFGHVAEVGMVLLAFRRGNPAIALVGIAIELAVAEVAAQQAKLPHVVGDVFANVAYRAVGADNYFLI